MTISIWRCSHLTLAIFSALFILTTSLTGVILTFEPITKKLSLPSTPSINTISIAETITVLHKKHQDIITIEVDENNFVLAKVITKKGKSERFYINPKTGEKIGNLIPKHPLFEFVTNLHRSLFLKSTGRFIIGFVSFLLFLIAITGLILIAKRQGGFHKIFSKVIKENFNQYYHVTLSRYFLIPILIITLTGVYLSLIKFSLLPKSDNSHQKLEVNKTHSTLKPTDFEFFKRTKLKHVKKIEFPFSSDNEDYFFIKTINKELSIHQFNGQIISYKEEPITTIGSYYSLILHTGRGSIIWSIILMLACFAILFFIFSGFYMTLKRRRKVTPTINENEKDETEFIILVGSETGSTFRFANAFKMALIKAKKSVFLTELNNYNSYKKAKHIIIFTATYGDGEAPENANIFLKLLNKIEPINDINYSILGFGSKEYPAFCKYAILVDEKLQTHQKFKATIPLFKIDNQDIKSFNTWVNRWSLSNTIPLKIDGNYFLENNKKTTFEVVKVTTLNIDNTFLIELKPKRKIRFTSGDLLSIIPKNEIRNRLYSIAKIDNKILLSVKKHEFGICSNYLYNLKNSTEIIATIQPNKNFYLPKKAKDIILIANGTGIAPFLGMVSNNKKKNIHLFWGGRTKESLEIYIDKIKKSLSNKSLASFNPVFSQEQKERQYVQDILKDYSELIIKTVKNKGCILICGSLVMQKGVETVIESIIKKEFNMAVKQLKQSNQIKTDCY